MNSRLHTNMTTRVTKSIRDQQQEYAMAYAGKHTDLPTQDTFLTPHQAAVLGRGM